MNNEQLLAVIGELRARADDLDRAIAACERLHNLNVERKAKGEPPLEAEDQNSA